MDVSDEELSQLTVKDVQRTFQGVMEQTSKVVIGGEETIEFLFIGMLCGAHIYLEGVPGIAKTWTTNAFTTTMGCDFNRIQFTPDMLPSDIVGTNIFNPKTGTFRLKKGPIFANVILADEINRAPPKTQSAMLEAMAEGQVSIEGETHKLAQPFCVIATANPVEQEGTYPLPEAQLDRFLVKLNLEYVSPDDELEIIRVKNNPKPAKLEAVTSPQALVQMQKVVKNVYTHDDILKYIRDIIIRSREDPRLALGASPRASISLLVSAKARAAIEGRNYCVPDDVLYMINHVLHHRLIMKPEAELEGISQKRVAKDISNEVNAPVELEVPVMFDDFEDEEDF